ncbi:MAG TPA: hypothetical protein VJO16_10790 [Candidatus Acidoferrum sp.]|nr:hypothetical protein [Candidatus Acidoferrum sp.]
MQTFRLSGFLLLLLCFSVDSKSCAIALESSADDSSVAAAPSASPALPAPKPASNEHFNVGVGVQVSTLGIGGEIALPITHRSNARFGFNAFSYSHTFDKDGVTYKGSLDMRSAQAVFDFFPFNFGFRLSPGALLYNGNKVNANASVPGGQSFTLNGASYVSDAASPVTGTGKLTFSKAAPMLLLGFGNLVPRGKRRFSMSFDIGAAYQGPPRATLALSGNACDSTALNCRAISSDPTIQSNILAEQAKINKSASPFRFSPIVSFGVGYKF